MTIRFASIKRSLGALKSVNTVQEDLHNVGQDGFIVVAYRFVSHKYGRPV